MSNSRIARELEVLYLIADGISKVHLKHIYGKLDVNSRTQAVVRRREVNLRSYPSFFNKIPLPIPLSGDDISPPG